MRILVVEDEKEIGNFITDRLRSENYAVDLIRDGYKGLNHGQLHDYDIAVLDINLPGTNGLEICRKLRSSKKEFPIIMLTVHNDTATKVEAFNFGADDYLVKPFCFEELHARIKALLRREKKIIGTTLKVEDLEMDTLKQEVARGNKVIDLSRKEYSLLEYLIRNRGITLTRSMILEHVWDMNADPFTNTVDVHISFLRSKIDDPFKKKILHTVHGRGYRLG